MKTKLWLFLLLLPALAFGQFNPIIHNQYTTNTPAGLPVVQAEANAFAKTNGITDPAAIAALAGMEMELKNYGVFSNLVDAVLLYPRFNPNNGNTFLGRSYTNRNLQFGNWGVTNFGGIMHVDNLPYMTNGSILVVYGKASINAGDAAGSIVGLYNPNSGKTNELFLKSNPRNYDGLISVTNNALWIAAGGITGDFPNTYLSVPNGISRWTPGAANGPPTSGQQQLIARCDLFSWNTNGTVTHWRNGIQSQFAQNNGFNPTIPVLFFSGFSNLFIGQEPAGTGSYFAPQQQVCAVMVFNAELSSANSNLAVASTRAARWLDPAHNDIVVLGDSRMMENGLCSFDGGLQVDAAANDSYIYNWSGNGQSISSYTNTLFGGTLGNIYSILSNIRCVQKNNLYFGLGVNDIGLQNQTGASCFQMLCYLYSNTPPDFNFIVGTVYEYANNGSVGAYPSVTIVNTNITWYNSLVISNANIFSGGYVDQWSLAHQYLRNGTNAGNSIDGLHFYGTNGAQIQSLLSQAWTRPQNNVSPAYTMPFQTAFLVPVITNTVGPHGYNLYYNASGWLTNSVAF